MVLLELAARVLCEALQREDRQLRNVAYMQCLCSNDSPHLRGTLCTSVTINVLCAQYQLQRLEQVLCDREQQIRVLLRMSAAVPLCARDDTLSRALEYVYKVLRCSVRV